MREFTISEDSENQRLDKFLMKLFNQAPRSLLFRLLRQKKIKYNNKKAVGSELLQAGDQIQIYLSEETLDSFWKSKTILKTGYRPIIVYEDLHVLLLNKPAGLLSHPADREHALMDSILEYLADSGSYDTAASAHFTPALSGRLDRNTSGLIFCGKTLPALQALNAAMKNHTIQKHYLGLVKGQVLQEETLVGWHVKDTRTNQVRIHEAEVSGSRQVETFYRPLSTNGEYSLIEIQLITGRSHQIREHLRQKGYPLIGDPKYGDPETNEKFDRQYGLKHQLLHCHKLQLISPEPPLTELKNQTFTAEPDMLFRNIIRGLSL